MFIKSWCAWACVCDRWKFMMVALQWLSVKYILQFVWLRAIHLSHDYRYKEFRHVNFDSVWTEFSSFFFSPHNFSIFRYRYIHIYDDILWLFSRNLWSDTSFTFSNVPLCKMLEWSIHALSFYKVTYWLQQISIPSTFLFTFICTLYFYHSGYDSVSCIVSLLVKRFAWRTRTFE